jgi:phosphoribosyl-dephospho-CoA transferase
MPTLERSSLPRHSLVRLSPAGWQQVQTGSWLAEAAACLAHWAQHDLPLVVTRQRTLPGGPGLSLGLPAPQRWQRQRLSLKVAPEQVYGSRHFPLAAEIQPCLPVDLHADWRLLRAQLSSVHVMARIYGSFGWQVLTGLDHVHDSSDLDLLLPVRSAEQADLLVRLLLQAPWRGPRLDGELLFPDGSAVAWREWPVWRSGRAKDVLLKRRDDTVLERGAAWLRQATAVAARAL